MSSILFFSKVNLNSHIYSVYEDPDTLRILLNRLFTRIQNGVTYEREEPRIDEDGDVFIYKASYKFSSIDKFQETIIVGNIIKTSNLLIKRINERTGEVTKIPVENSEIIQFYFDTRKEVVAFYTTQRFGYSEFNIGLKELINKCMKDNNEDYNFEVELIKSGLDIKTIKSELKKIRNIETLKIEIIPPNPDEPILEAIHNNGEEEINAYKAANITNRSILFSSKAPQGLNIDADIVEQEINRATTIHSTLTAEEAIKNSYVSVEAEAKDGSRYSTKDNRPLKRRIKEYQKTKNEFFEVCRRYVSSLF